MRDNKKILTNLIKEFYPFAKQRLGFDKSCKIIIRPDAKNASDPLGKTAHYEPTTNTIVVYSTNRHPKDLLRSCSHELCHHAQNCRGEFDSIGPTEEGYAQNDKHLRKMEEEAYLQGNLIFRDWEDSRKSKFKENITLDTKSKLFESRNLRLMGKLFDTQGITMRETYDPKELRLDPDVGVKLHNWHMGQNDPIYMVGSLAYAGKAIPRHLAIDAKDTLEGLLDHYKGKEEEEELFELVDELSTAIGYGHGAFDDEMEEACNKKRNLEESIQNAVRNVLSSRPGKKILEKLQFDVNNAHSVNFQEELDPLLVNDIREMIEAGETDEDVFNILIRGEGLDKTEADRYIKKARLPKTEDSR